MKKLLLLAVVSLFLVNGCASIMSSSTKPISIKSIPEADFTIKERRTEIVVHKGVTPQSIFLNSKGGYFRSKEYDVTFTKDGFVDHVVFVNSSVSGWYFPGNLGLSCLTLIGGVIGFLIEDPLTGAMWTLDPKDINAIMETPDHYKERIEKERMDKIKEEQQKKAESEKQSGVGSTGWGGK